MNKQVLIEKPEYNNLEKQGIFNWPIWEKGVSTFDWFYDCEEQCYFLEGEVELATPEGTYKFGKGDFVIFKKGLQCTWKVIKPVKKHYNFL